VQSTVVLRRVVQLTDLNLLRAPPAGIATSPTAPWGLRWVFGVCSMEVLSTERPTQHRRSSYQLISKETVFQGSWLQGYRAFECMGVSVTSYMGLHVPMQASNSTEREGETRRFMLWMGALILVSLMLGTISSTKPFQSR
jgi:hypothetical protein